ncbi:MAG: UTP--glucose-1-phosphate uridylyltransferase [Mycoplasmataceae bacterium]|jgi:UTP--glucose-1-phosphate uridylyltransferase|nr:UTP--glucose-1-phosphate uridylyltransferase [Mycoplasmataceae bacterium]
MQFTKITKAVIPAAGLGSRFLPVTKSIPKEMIPILDTPTIDLIVQEAIQSGIKEILIIVSSTKYAVRNFYKRNHRLEKFLIKKNKTSLCKKIENIGHGVKIHFKLQIAPKGLGHAIYLAKSFTKNEPFAVLLGDDITLNDDKQTTPVIGQLMDAYNKYHQSILGVKNVPHKDVNQYGIIKIKSTANIKDKLYEVESVIEKPKITEAPSDLAITGRYILTPQIFHYLKKQKIGVGDEIQLTDAIMELLADQRVYALNYDGVRYDIGSKKGLVRATIDFALKDPNLKEDVSEYIFKLTKTIK